MAHRRRHAAPLRRDTRTPDDGLRLLYGLYAILRLHNAQEEEGAFSLLPDEPAVGAELAVC